MNDLPALTDHELVVHLFAPAEGTTGIGAYRELGRIWSACTGELAMHKEVTATLPTAPPIDPDLLAEGPIAACEAAGDGVIQAIFRCERDTFCLSLVLDPANLVSWADLDRRWSRIVAGSADSLSDREDFLFGEARLYLAQSHQIPADVHHASPGRVPPGDTAGGTGLGGMSRELAAAVRAAMPGDVAEPWWRDGVLVPTGFAVWEAVERRNPDADARAVRRIAAVTAHGDGDTLSGWTWTPGGLRLPAFPRYLLHAARIRYQIRVWSVEQPELRRIRRETDEAISDLLHRLGTGDGDAGGDVDEISDAELFDGLQRLTRLELNDAGLALGSTRLREIRRTVEIARANMAKRLPWTVTPAGGLFADDRELASWFDEQLDDDSSYAEATRERARVVSTIVERVIRRRQQQRSGELQDMEDTLYQRQEWFTRVQTMAIGVVGMVLTAIQTFGYQLPLPGPTQAPMIVLLGAVTLLLSSVVFRYRHPSRHPDPSHSPERSRMASLGWLEPVAVGCSGAAGVWLAISWISYDLGSLASPAWTAGPAGGAFALCTAGAACFARRRATITP